MTPKEWRKKVGLTCAEAAASVGILGSNPARTWQRWEAGERRPPTAVVAKIQKLSEGRVTSERWPNVIDGRRFRSGDARTVGLVPEEQAVGA